MPEHSINSEIAHELQKKRLKSLEERKHERLEMLEALLLAIVAIATAWSGYQSAKWDGRSADSYSQATSQRIDGDSAIMLGGEQRLRDSATFNTWLISKANGNDKMSALLERRFSPDYKPAFDVWLAAEPLTNENAPPGPTFMAEYKNKLEEDGAALRHHAAELMDRGRNERETGEDYVRLTVFLATVLFLIAIAQRLSSKTPQMILLILAGAATVVVVVMLANYPHG